MNASDSMGFPIEGEIAANAKGGSEETPRTSVPSDEELLARLQTVDTDALAQLFARYSRLMLAIAFRVLQDREEAEDLVQDVFIHLFFKGRLFDPAKGSARAWITQITYHRSFDRRRYLKARFFYDPNGDAETDGPLPPRSGENIEEFLAWQSCLRPAFDELTENQRRTLLLHFYEGYSLKEIGEKLGQSFGNVQHHLYRGLDRLRRHVFKDSG